MKLIYSAVLILVLACTANAQLTLDWCRCAGAGEDEELTDLISLPDGSVIAIGFQYRTTGNGDDNPYIVKVDDNGTLLWTFTEDYQSAEERIYCGTKSSDGNIVVAGSFDPTTGTIDNGYALKINAATGTLMWRNATYFGNSGDDFIYGMLSLANNVTLMVGKTGGRRGRSRSTGMGVKSEAPSLGQVVPKCFERLCNLAMAALSLWAGRTVTIRMPYF
ncbi:MAG: hypothetical protein H6508_08315 [Calditrichaeota bacterium]|nr:hypothetical protein [Calditrichota bacterium]